METERTWNVKLNDREAYKLCEVVGEVLDYARNDKMTLSDEQIKVTEALFKNLQR